MSKKIIKNKQSSELNSAIAKIESPEITFDDLHLPGEKHFKLRAECFDDALFLFKRLPVVWGIKLIQWGPMPDFELEFKTKITSEEILAILEEHEDAHVMMDTLRPFEEYTGKR